MIAPYISRHEYVCPCCGKLPPGLYNFGDHYNQPFQELFDAFKEIREAKGEPINITSGYRCPKHNDAVGGVPLSVHLFGLALDLDCGDANEVLELKHLINMTCRDLRMGTYMVSGTFIHIDVGYMISPRAVNDWARRIRWQK